MHSINDLKDYFSWTYPQARKRVMLLKQDFNREVEGGENRKYLVTDNGFKLLERLNELEKDGHNLKSGLSQIKEEMESPDSNGENLEVKSAKISIKYVERLEQENQFLKEEIERLHNLLPASSINGKGILRRIWERVW